LQILIDSLFAVFPTSRGLTFDSLAILKATAQGNLPSIREAFTFSSSSVLIIITSALSLTAHRNKMMSLSVNLITANSVLYRDFFIDLTPSNFPLTKALAIIREMKPPFHIIPPPLPREGDKGGGLPNKY